jgi:hypothetical protein
MDASWRQFVLRISVAAPDGLGEQVVVPSRAYIGVDRFTVTIEDVPLDLECIVSVADPDGRR